MKHFIRLMAFTFALLVLVPSAVASERAVLLPVTGPLTPNETAVLAEAVANSLAGRFELVRGEVVDAFVKKTFIEESKKKDCDEINCYRRIAQQYQAEKIIAFRVTLIAQARYLITFNVFDVATGEMVLGTKAECTDCTFEKIKTMSVKLISTAK